MKHILIPAGKTYKANLHTHTNLSDGNKTPEEIRADYLAHGYSVVAYTDHNLLLDHKDLCTEDFVALNGLEFDLGETVPPFREKHINMIALEPDNLIQPCWHRQIQFFPDSAVIYRPLIRFDEKKPDFEREFTADCFNRAVKEAAETGFFVTYNHPDWNRDRYADYSQYHGMHAMEIRNYSCTCNGYDEDNGAVYEELLNLGNRLFCIAADDTHSKRADDHPNLGAYGGYIRLWADKLEYREVTKALEQGHFYACAGDSDNEGPEIRELTYENGVLTVRTSPALRISVRTDLKNRSTRSLPLTEAEFRLKEGTKWFRVVVEDERGNKAFSNAYFTDELQ